MDQDRQHTKQFTDEELALRRHARFGQLPARVVPNDQLPARVLPNDLIETKETDPPHEEPQEPVYRGEWGPEYLERQLGEPRAGREEGRGHLRGSWWDAASSYIIGPVIIGAVMMAVLDVTSGIGRAVCFAIALSSGAVLFFAREYRFRRTHTPKQRAALAAKHQSRRDRIKFASGNTAYKRKILRTGVEARAVITDVERGNYDADSHETLVYLELAVTVGADAPYAVRTGEYARDGWPRSSLTVGRELAVRVDQDDSRRVAVDWFKSQFLQALGSGDEADQTTARQGAEDTGGLEQRRQNWSAIDTLVQEFIPEAIRRKTPMQRYTLGGSVLRRAVWLLIFIFNKKRLRYWIVHHAQYQRDMLMISHNGSWYFNRLNSAGKAEILAFSMSKGTQRREPAGTNPVEGFRQAHRGCSTPSP